jgi:hypothetical protein
MNKLIKVLCIVVAILIGFGLGSYNNTQKKYKMNLKCIQGELYEEIRPKFYVKSHLDCFEERTF